MEFNQLMCITSHRPALPCLRMANIGLWMEIKSGSLMEESQVNFRIDKVGMELLSLMHTFYLLLFIIALIKMSWNRQWADFFTVFAKTPVFLD